MYNDEDWDEGYSMPFSEEDDPGRSREGWVFGGGLHQNGGIAFGVIKHGKLGNPLTNGASSGEKGKVMR